MKPEQPRPIISHPYRRGTLLAHGVVFDASVLGEGETARRSLAWDAAVMRRDGDVVWIELRTPTRLACEDAPGVLLGREGNVLSSVPLDSHARRACLGIDALWVRHGATEILPSDAAHIVDPSEWIDVSEVQLHAVRSLGRVLERPADPAPLRENLREAFGVGIAPPEAAGLEGVVRGEAGARAIGSLLALLELPFSLASRWIERLRTRTTEQSPSANPSPSRSTGDPLARPSALERALDRASAWLRSMILRSQLGRIALRAQADYFRKLLDLFEGGDLDEALRRAIPLGGMATGDEGKLALGTPAPRTDLAIRTRVGRAGTSLATHPSLYEVLRQRYRRAFDLLVARGEIDKAAFVLAELLFATQEAVSFLEKHGRFTLAAELAEARKLPPGLLVRLWFLAGDRERAIDIARRFGAFADAALRLDRDHPEHAEALRSSWADGLASSGAFAAAIDVVWPYPRLRPLAHAWMEHAIALGGPTAARMRLRKLGLVPETWSEQRGAIEEILEREGEDADLEIDALVDGLGSAPRGLPLGFVAQLAVRALLRRGHSGDALTAARLVERAQDPALATDVHSLPPMAAAPEVEGPTGVWSKEVRTFSRSAAEVGTLAIHDAVRLADGRLLLALGELGVSLRTAEGRELLRFAQPASHLVASDGGDRFITLMFRGESCRLGRIEIIQRRAETWCDAPIDSFANSFDGLVWFVVSRGTAYAIDATASGWQHRWKLDAVNAVERSPDAVTFCVADPLGEQSLWRYRLPAMTLADKVPFDRQIEQAPHTALHAFDAKSRWVVVFRDGESMTLGVPGMPGADLPRGATRCFFEKELLAVASVDDRGGWLGLFDPQSARAKARFELDGARDVGVRVLGGRAVIFDDRGRLLVVSLRTQQVLSEVRL